MRGEMVVLVVQGKTKLWVDDLRAPSDFLFDYTEWAWVKTPLEAIEYLEENDVKVISFDHDLGESEEGVSLDSRSIVYWLIENNYSCDEYRVHSANPVGREWLTAMIARYLS